MKRTASRWLVLVACTAIVGCYPNLSRQEQSIASGQKADVSSHLFFPIILTGNSKKCDNTSACDASIDFTICYLIFGCYGTVKEDEIHLKNGVHDIDIIWSLPSGFWFCDNLGDGVFLKVQDDYDQNQFDQMKVAGSPGGPNNRCSPQYHWRGKNTKSRPAQGFPYRVVFRYAVDNRIYVADPWIFND